MNKDNVLKAIKELKEKGPKRNFEQSFDLIITLKGLDLKNPEQQVDQYIQLHYSRGKPVKVCGLVAEELYKKAQDAFDTAVIDDDFAKYQKDKKLLKKLANEHDFFVAQANIMPKVATAFGRVLGPKGKMPNPKAGCIVPPNADLTVVKKRLEKSVRLKATETPQIQALIGKENMNEEELVDNIITIYNAMIHALPQERNNIQSVILKLTMSKPVKLEK